MAKSNTQMSVEKISLTMAQAVVKYLSVQFSERDSNRQRLIPAVFGIFGHGNVAGLGQALYEYGDDLPYYQTRNEQSMVHTAIGFAKANHRLATLACTSSIGPGATNMLTGAATATINRVPVLLLPSDYYATRHQGPVLQQLEHPISADVSVNDCFRPVSRFFDRIHRPEQLLTALPEAMRVLTDTAETGAVTICLPQDVQAHAYDYPASFFEPRTWRVERRSPDSQRILEAVALLRVSKRPLIVAGGGVHFSEAWKELALLSDTLGIPVGETFVGRGAIRTDSAMLLGGIGVTGTSAAGKIASEADLVICVGTRMTDFTTGSHSAFNAPDVKFIGINTCAHDAFKMGAMPIVSDAREALIALSTAAVAAGIKPSVSYTRQIADYKASWAAQIKKEVYVAHPGELLSQGELIGILNEEAKAGDTVIAAAGGVPGDLHKLWDASNGRNISLEFGNSCMGYEIPGGIGHRMAQASGEVYVCVGDGTYLMNPCELVTALQEGLKITVVVPDNHGFQIIRNLQMGRVGRSFGNEFRSRGEKTKKLDGEDLAVDLAKNAESMGARTWRASTVGEVRQALREARRERRSCVIVVEVEKHRYLPSSGVWWDVAAAEVTGDNVTRELRRAYEEDRANLQRFYY